MAQERDQIKVRFTNGNAGGYVDYRYYPKDITAGELFLREMGQNADATKHYIHVNGERIGRSDVIEDGDRVSISPAKLTGA